MTDLTTRVCFGLIAICLLASPIKPAFSACERIQFLQDRSRGVSILFNTCDSHKAVAPGTLLRLAPGARLWLASTGNEGSQMVCQSQADVPLTLLVNQSDPPWLSSGGENCRLRGKRFTCRDGENGATTLLCVVGPLSQAPVAGRPRQGTSLVLRSAFADKGLQDPSRRKAVVAELKQTARLCHELYQVDRLHALSWTVDPDGKVVSVNVPAGLTRSHPRLAGCLVDLIRTFPYPPSPRAVTLSSPL